MSTISKLYKTRIDSGIHSIDLLAYSATNSDIRRITEKVDDFRQINQHRTGTIILPVPYCSFMDLNNPGDLSLKKSKIKTSFSEVVIPGN